MSTLGQTIARSGRPSIGRCSPFITPASIASTVPPVPSASDGGTTPASPLAARVRAAASPDAIPQPRPRSTP